MDKKAVVAVLEEIAMLLELSGENPFKARTYTNVARALEQTEEDLEVLVREQRLREIKGVGDALEQKLTELLQTGALAYHQELRSRFPPTLFDLFRIAGLGAKRIKVLYEELGIDSLDALEQACASGRIKDLKGFGPKMQEKILEGLAFAREHAHQYRFDIAFQEARRLRDYLAHDPSVIRIEVAGSIRRRKEIVKDLDILASSRDPKALMRRFVEAEGVATVTAHGETKSSVVLTSGIAADLRVVTDTEFPYALHHFTGSKEHNVAMRQRAKERGLKMNEYGLYRGDTNVVCKDETAIFAQLDLPYIPPELREDLGEFDAEVLPALVTEQDLIGLIHCHTTYSDGTAPLEQMVRAAEERGYRYIVISDHSQSASYAGGLSPAAVGKQHTEIDKLNKVFKTIRILKGIESDIRGDGSLDYDESVLASFEVVIASVHSKLDMAEPEATARLVKAIENPHTDILGHPTGRLLLQRQGYDLNFERIFDACAANGVAIEINAHCSRLDLDWRHIRRAKEKGLLFVIGPDAHSLEGLDDVQYGVGIARKGWLEAADLLNCMNEKEFLKWLRSRRA